MLPNGPGRAGAKSTTRSGRVRRVPWWSRSFMLLMLFCASLRLLEYASMLVVLDPDHTPAHCEHMSHWSRYFAIVSLHCFSKWSRASSPSWWFRFQVSAMYIHAQTTAMA